MFWWSREYKEKRLPECSGGAVNIKKRLPEYSEGAGSNEKRKSGEVRLKEYGA